MEWKGGGEGKEKGKGGGPPALPPLAHWLLPQIPPCQSVMFLLSTATNGLTSSLIRNINVRQGHYNITLSVPERFNASSTSTYM